jgi:hypothetical protein
LERSRGGASPALIKRSVLNASDVAGSAPGAAVVINAQISRHGSAIAGLAMWKILCTPPGFSTSSGGRARFIRWE